MLVRDKRNIRPVIARGLQLPSAPLSTGLNVVKKSAPATVFPGATSRLNYKPTSGAPTVDEQLWLHLPAPIQPLPDFDDRYFYFRAVLTPVSTIMTGTLPFSDTLLWARIPDTRLHVASNVAEEGVGAALFFEPVCIDWNPATLDYNTATTLLAASVGGNSAFATAAELSVIIPGVAIDTPTTDLDPDHRTNYLAAGADSTNISFILTTTTPTTVDIGVGVDASVVGRTIYFFAGPNDGQHRIITAYNPGTGIATLDLALPAAPHEPHSDSPFPFIPDPDAILQAYVIYWPIYGFRAYVQAYSTASDSTAQCWAEVKDFSGIEVHTLAN